MHYLRQGTAVTLVLGPFLDKADAVTPKTALTLTVKVAKNGGAKAARNSASAITHDADGEYLVPLDATDTGTAGRLRVGSHDGATFLPVWQDYMVLPAVVYDSLVAGTDNLQVDAIQINGGALSGNNATLSLKKLSIVNDAGDALVASSTGVNGSGINASGNGSGAGMKLTGGASGNGLQAVGGTASGAGALIKGGTPVGVFGTSDGLNLQAGQSGVGLKVTGGNNAGDGMVVQSDGGGNGIMVRGAGPGHSGIFVFNATSEGPGLSLQGQSGFAGLEILGDGGDAMVVTAGTNGNGINVLGDGTGDAVRLTGGATGHGLHVLGGTTSGNGLQAEAQGAGKGSDGLSMDAIKGDTTAAQSIARTAATIVNGQILVGSTATVFKTDRAGTGGGNDLFKGRTLLLYQTDAAGAQFEITAFDDTTGDITVTNPSGYIPADADAFVIV